MSWFSKKSSQDYGDYLPDDEATLQQETIPIQANNPDEAREICKEEAKPSNTMVLMQMPRSLKLAKKIMIVDLSSGVNYEQVAVR